MMALPDSFNGRYLFTAQGGAAGFVPDPTEEHLRLGYAIASTDKGVTGTHLFDFSFRSNEAQSLDWSHRGAHVARSPPRRSRGRITRSQRGIGTSLAARAARPAGFIVEDTTSKALNGSTYDLLTDADYSGRSTTPSQPTDVTRLARIQEKGSKLLLWIGMADEAIPPQGFVNYLEDLNREYGVDRSRGEGAPTDTPQKMLQAAQAWVEEGVAPDSVVVSNPTRTFLLCSHPKRSRFNGGIENSDKLDINDANNWSCQD